MREHTTEEIDERLELLDRYERRSIARFLRETETDQIPVSELVCHLQNQDQTPDERSKLTVTLRHTHLPKLDATDAFDYDSRSETVRYSGDELLESLLESLAKATVRPSEE